MSQTQIQIQIQIQDQGQPETHNCYRITKIQNRNSSTRTNTKNQRVKQEAKGLTRKVVRIPQWYWQYSKIWIKTEEDKRQKSQKSSNQCKSLTCIDCIPCVSSN